MRNFASSNIAADPKLRRALQKGLRDGTGNSENMELSLAPSGERATPIVG